MKGMATLPGKPTAERLTIALATIILSILINVGAAVASQRPIPAILISVDTLRADHLNCYGYHLVRTANICHLARGGTLFTQISSQYPLTLPSHVSMLTSTYPFVSGVEDNGEVLSAGTVTLPGVLRSHGYRTAAFIGGFVLDARFGLNQGFDLYDSPFEVNRGPTRDIGDVKRFGEEVIQSASSWIERNSTEPFFVFIHLYDLHTPYTFPLWFKPPHGASGYNAEISYIDAVLGRLWTTLGRLGLYQRALIILTADHGEGLGQHNEGAHGYFIYQSTLRVPLIIHWPVGLGWHATSVAEPGSLIDVAPTILKTLGITPPPQFQGHSLLGLTAPRSSSPQWSEKVYAESLYGQRHFDVAPLRSIRVGRYKYIDAPRPELYDLKDDPGESKNLFSTRRDIALALQEQLGNFRRRYQINPAATAKAVSPEVAARLRSLGYVALSGPEAASNHRRADPKERIQAFNKYDRALTLSSHGRLNESREVLQQLLVQDPHLTDVRLSLGLILQRLGLQTAAADEFRRVLAQDRLNVVAHFDLGISYYSLRRVDAAAKEFQATLAIAPYYTRAEEMLGNIALAEGDFAAARGHFENVLRYDVDDFGAHYNLGAIAVREGRWDAALLQLKDAVEAEPRSPQAHNTLGSYYFLRGNLHLATQQFMEAIRLDPSFAQAHYNLGLVFQKESRADRATEEFKLALQSDASLTAAREALNDLRRRP